MLRNAPRDVGVILIWGVLWLWPGVRRAGLPRQSPAREPGQRRCRRRLDLIRLNSATQRRCHMGSA
jgi:hypothetical protein